VSALNEDVTTTSNPFAARMNSNIASFVAKEEKKKKYLFDYFYVNTDTMSTQWTAPYKTVPLLLPFFTLNIIINNNIRRKQ